jgi:hypothetical protein
LAVVLRRVVVVLRLAVASVRAAEVRAVLREEALRVVLPVLLARVVVLLRAAGLRALVEVLFRAAGLRALVERLLVVVLFLAVLVVSAMSLSSSNNLLTTKLDIESTANRRSCNHL